jgi:signal peptidase II
MHKAWPWFALAAGVIVLDQATKWAVLAHFSARPPGEVIDIVPRFFRLVLVANPAAAFGIGKWLPEGWRAPVLIAIGVAAVAFISAYLVRRPERRLACAGFAMILGGALGNVVDRLRFDRVVDFLDFHGIWPWVFNLADASITVGAAVLILDELRGRRSEKHA